VEISSRAATGCSFLLFGLLLRPIPAAAQVDATEFEVYPYATLPRGMMELETLNAVVPSGRDEGGEGVAGGTFASQGTWYNAYEITYGLTDRIEAAAYLNLALPEGHGLWWAGDKFRLRGRLFNEGKLPVDLSWYAELEWHKTPEFDDEDLELELKPIVEKDFGRLSLIANPVFEKVLVGSGRHEGFEFGYRNGVYYRWKRFLSPGVEFYGGMGLINRLDPPGNQQHYIFPVVWGKLPHGIEYNVGPGFGLTHDSDRVILKFNIELERFVGALFSHSSDSGWFF
jgi:hypothetical protein